MGGNDAVGSWLDIYGGIIQIRGFPALAFCLASVLGCAEKKTKCKYGHLFAINMYLVTLLNISFSL